MIYQQIKPPQSLSGYVRSFWVLEGGLDNTDIINYRLMADNCPNMVFHYNNNFSILSEGKYTASRDISFLHGQSNLSMDMETKGRFGIFGVYLYPFTLQYLFKTPASELSDTEIDLETLLKKESKILDDIMLNAIDNNERINIISEFLLKKLRDVSINDAGVEHGVKQMINSNGITRIEAIASMIGISNRQFERRFINHAGMNPKMFSRISRFHNTLKSANTLKLNLTKLAYDCGYADQSHFIREFKEFSGMSPGNYFKKIPDSADNFAVIS